MLIEIGLIHSKENLIIKHKMPYHIKMKSITQSKNTTQFENQKFKFQMQRKTFPDTVLFCF